MQFCIFSGGVIHLTGWTWLDPVTGLLIAVLILYSSREISAESFVLALDGVPQGIDLPHLQQELLQLDNVLDIHHIHIRAISTSENELTAHIKIQNIFLLEETKKEVKGFLLQHNIHHSVLEFENNSFCCSSRC